MTEIRLAKAGQAIATDPSNLSNVAQNVPPTLATQLAMLLGESPKASIAPAPAATLRPTIAQIEQRLVTVTSELIGSTISLDVPLMEAGLDSLGATELRTRLASQFVDVDLPETLAFDYPTVRELILYIDDSLPIPKPDEKAAMLLKAAHAPRTSYMVQVAIRCSYK